MLSIDDVHVSFREVRALSGVSIDAVPGEIVGLIGSNGSGKSTLFNVVAGIIVPDAGRVALNGRSLPLGRPDQVVRRGIARTFQSPRLARRLTVVQNMMAGHHGHPGENLVMLLARPWSVRSAEKAITDQAFTMLERLGLCHVAGHLAGDLSGGQQKLLSMGMALMASPSVILLDEPAAGVNPILIKQQIRLLREFVVEGRIALIIEHNIEMMMEICDHMIVLDAGSVVTRGTPHAICQDAALMRSYLGAVA